MSRPFHVRTAGKILYLRCYDHPNTISASYLIVRHLINKLRLKLYHCDRQCYLTLEDKGCYTFIVNGWEMIILN